MARILNSLPVSLLFISFCLLTQSPAQDRRGMQIMLRIDKDHEVSLYKNSYALVIGASNYNNGWPKLPGVLEDVQAVKRALEANGFTVSTLLDPVTEQLEKGIRDFIAKNGNDPENRLLFYFAGHGHTERLAYGGEMGYIVPVNAPNPNVDKNGFLNSAIDMQLFDSYARRIQAKHALFLFDACFSGSIFALSRAVPENISYKTTQPVRQFITSGAANETVPDKSVFRDMFIEAIAGDADRNKDGYVTGVELGEYLQENVANYSRESQHPQYGKIRDQNLDKGDFVFQVGNNSTLPISANESKETAKQADTKGYLGELETEAKRIENEKKKVEDTRLSEKEKINQQFKAMKYAFEAVMSYEKRDIGTDLKVRAWNKFVADFGNTNIPGTDEDESMINSAREHLVDLGVGGNDFVDVKGGAFEMGDVFSEGRADEKPIRKVTLKDFAMSKFEVTVGQFQKFVNETGYTTDAEKVGASYIFENGQWVNKPGVSFKNPGYVQSSTFPVTHVSWNDAAAFCAWMSRSTNTIVRLPVETQWEYAAREGGKKLRYAGCQDAKSVGDFGWMSTNSGQHTQRVGQKKANALGLYDMTGNLWEWCGDFKASNYATNPSGKEKVMRGGSWDDDSLAIRNSFRGSNLPNLSFSNVGFRIVRYARQ